MKHLQFIFIALTLLLLGCSRPSGTTISGKIEGKQVTKINYSVPINGFAYSGFKESVPVDSLGNFTINIDIDKAAFVTIDIPEINISRKMIVEPKQCYELTINKDGSNAIEIIGTNTEGQDIYQTFPNPYIAEMMLSGYEDIYRSDSVHQQIMDKKDSEISQFQVLLDNKKISEEFFNLIKIDRDCYYTALGGMLALSRLTFVEDERKEITYLIDGYKMYPIENKELTRSSFWHHYIEIYLSAKMFMKSVSDEWDPQTTVFSIAEEELKDEQLEYFKAMHLYRKIYIVSFSKEYNDDSFSLFEKFKKDYPESKYTKYIESIIKEIDDFKDTAKQPFGESIKFIPESENINSLQDLIALFKGKKLYIDIWATWCSSCIGEFKYNERLRKVLKEQERDLIYISLDDESSIERWEGMIKYYTLEGNHIRANDKLHNDLRAIYPKENIISIPWYIMIDENGNITEAYAPNPSDLIKNIE